jgi:hypothetical protein
MARSIDKDFLVRLSGKYFYIARIPNDRRMHGTLYMSYGLRMSYRVACEVALRIRNLGWSDALVTNLNGDPISLDNIPVEEHTPQGPDDRELASVWEENVKSLETKLPDAPSPAFAV